jgi:hypothetical protein
MKIGDIDVTNSILNLEHDINVLQQVLNHLFQNNKNLIGPSLDEIERFKENAVLTLQKKYPSMGITKK